MNGIELSKKYFETHGRAMLRAQFADCADRIAAGIAGQGSECFGYDDVTSQDHDYEAGFWLWLTREDEERIGFRLTRAYTALPKTFEGVTLAKHNPFQTAKFGVCVIEDFYERLIGLPRPPQTEDEWLYTPDFALASATNGAVFCDKLGAFSAFRNALLRMPEDVRKKKVAARLALMAQSGQYNFDRCMAHDEPAAATLALSQFADNAIKAIFALNGGYAPFYKWSFRALSTLADGKAIYDDLAYVVTEQTSHATRTQKCERIERIASFFVQKLHALGWTALEDNYLEAQAYALTDGIKSRHLRSLHIFDGAE